jgi:hypothetical protein
MSNDLVNQLTLNFLISKKQLQKLNKKTKETTDEIKIKEIQHYNERIKLLFNNLLFCEVPDDLLFEVKNAFDNFIEKSIYYFKVHDNNDALEMERSSNDIKDDIDYEKEEREIENGNYEENDGIEKRDEEEDEEDIDDNNVKDEQETFQTNKKDSESVFVKSKYKNKTTSVGVDDIQKLPVDWFQNVRQNYKKNQIIPRKKEPTILENPLKNVKKKI